MEEIKVGEYVRTIYGELGKVKRINCYLDTKEPYSYTLENGQILDAEEDFKYSFNIIDLIEVGDYVNGVQVIEIATEHRNGKDEKALYMLSDMGTGYANTIFNEHIKSVVTKEQMKSVEYRLEER